MSSSSAYSNVLLKSPVQSQAAVQRRDYQDDQSSASFQQNFKDVHDNVRSRDEQITKAVPKKATQTAGNNNDKRANKADKNNSRDDVSANEKSSDTSEKLANQNADGKSSINKDSDSKTTAKKTGTDEDKSADASAETILATNTNTPAPVTPTGVAIPSMATTAESKTETDTALESTEAGVGAVKVNVGTSAEEDGKKSISTLTADDQAVTGKSTSDKGTTAADAALVNAQLAAGAAQTQPTANADAAEQQASSVLANVDGSAVLPKSATAQSTTTAAADEASDADSLGLLANQLVGEKSSSKTAVTGDIKAAATEASATQTQVLDPKSAFEKTLQNLVHPESRDESTSLQAATETSSTSSSTPSSTNVLDSLSRFSDTQTPAARSFVVQTAVPVPVGQPQWSQAVGEKVLWLAAQNVSAAEIHLNPENLGPMQVKVSVNQDQTTINFTSHHAVVREVLDQNMGRLRDMFSEQGLNLVNVDVSDKSFSRQQGDAKDQKGQANTNDINIEEEPTPAAMSAIVQQRLVDHYA